KRINPAFIDLAVDFIRTYADRCHHGKEENILFRDLSKKPLSSELKQALEELIEEHRVGRKTVAQVVEAKERYLTGDPEALSIIINHLQFLVDFYPRHIEKEDRHFFMPVMAAFSQAEKEAMLQEEYEFDKNLIHQIYKERIGRAEEMLEGI
ncbi:MAG: cation-binding protein, partial [Desulfobacca sp.]|nr:cation-binding protein [Desulfobacca sp.]